jgi:hypothetical protein
MADISLFSSFDELKSSEGNSKKQSNCNQYQEEILEFIAALRAAPKMKEKSNKRTNKKK